MDVYEEGAGSVPVLVVFAPTACGKTRLALDIFGKDSSSPFAGKAELISADSMQVYRGMNTGTAKPSSQELQQLPHHLVDIHNPDQAFSVGEFVRHSDQLCQEIISRKHIPLVLGGTGFYIRNFLCGLPTTPQADPQLRLELQQRLAQEGAEQLYRQLQQLDPVAAQRIHPNDHYRILRSLEVSLSSGQPQSSFNLSPQLRSQFKFCIIILWRERQELYQRIDARVAQMMEEGLPQEVASLVACGYKEEDPGMQAIGYHEFLANQEFMLAVQKMKSPISLDSFQENCSLVDFQSIQELICRNSRRYAKRQYTYFRGIPNATYFHAQDEVAVQEHIGKFLESSFPLLT